MADTGKIILGLGIFGALVTGPAWYALGRGSGQPPELQKPKDEKECVEPVSFMRSKHMELLNSWRNAVVRNDQHVYVSTTGKRYQISLTGTCLRCHEDPEKFCNKCHTYAAVETYCWDCHQQKRRGS